MRGMGIALTVFFAAGYLTGFKNLMMRQEKEAMQMAQQQIQGVELEENRQEVSGETDSMEAATQEAVAEESAVDVEAWGDEEEAVIYFWDSELENRQIETISEIEIFIVDTMGRFKTDMLKVETNLTPGYAQTIDDSGDVWIDVDGIRVIGKGILENEGYGVYVQVYIENFSYLEDGNVVDFEESDVAGMRDITLHFKIQESMDEQGSMAYETIYESDIVVSSF